MIQMIKYKWRNKANGKSLTIIFSTAVKNKVSLTFTRALLRGTLSDNLHNSDRHE